jgi:hypothetical protein
VISVEAEVHDRDHDTRSKSSKSSHKDKDRDKDRPSSKDKSERHEKDRSSYSYDMERHFQDLGGQLMGMVKEVTQEVTGHMNALEHTITHKENTSRMTETVPHSPKKGKKKRKKVGKKGKKRKRSPSTSSSSSSSSESSSEDSSDYESEDNNSDVDIAAAVKAGSSKAEPPEDTASEFGKALKALEKAFETEDQETGPDLHEAYAKILNASLRRRPNKETMGKVRSKYPRPGNVPNLQVPRTNKSVVSEMEKGAQIVDAMIQEAQLNVLKGLIPVLRVVDDISGGKNLDTATYLESMSDTTRLLGAAFSLLSQSRKDVLRNDVQYPLAKLCTWDIPVGETELIGVDITKKLKELGLDSAWKKKSGSKYKNKSHYKKGYSSDHKKKFTKKPFLEGKAKFKKKRKH